MRVKLLKKLRDKFCIKSNTIDVIKTIYSVKTLDRYTGGDPTNAEFYSYSYDVAVVRQSELILDYISKIKKYMFWRKF